MADFPSNLRTLTVKDAVYPKTGHLLNFDSTSGSVQVDLYLLLLTLLFRGS